MNLLIFIAIAINALGASADVTYDGSFEDFCTRHGGTINKRSHENITDGDNCRIIFESASGDKEEAMKMCKKWAPYTVNDAAPVDKYSTMCDITASRMCKDRDWKLIWDRCYKLVGENEIYTYSMAQRLCKSENATIVDLYSSDLAHILGARFLYGRVWVDTNGQFPIQNGLFRIRRATALKGRRIFNYTEGAKSSVICEYTPPSTTFTYKSKIEQFAEVYYHSEMNETRLYFRTSNFYMPVSRKDKLVWQKRCENALKVYGDDTRPKQPVPIPALRQMSDKLREQMVIAHLHGILAVESTMECQRRQRERHDFEYYIVGPNIDKWLLVDLELWQPGAPFGRCRVQGATALIQQAYNVPIVTDVSIAVRAPMWCGVFMESMPIRQCEEGYMPFGRSNGQVVCHMAVLSLGTWDEAQENCKKSGAVLSGFENTDELNFLIDLMGGIHTTIWMGAQRRLSCRGIGVGFRPEKTDECSRERAFEWKEGAASNDDPPFHHFFSSLSEPDYQYGDEDCLVLRRKKGKTILNDQLCVGHGMSFCQKTAEIIGSTKK